MTTGSLGLAAEPSALRVPALFAHHMVLQRDVDCPIWGWAEPGEQVTITIAEHARHARAGADGKWQTTLPAFAAEGPWELHVADEFTVSAAVDQGANDVLVTLSGQGTHGQTGVTTADFGPDIRVAGPTNSPAPSPRARDPPCATRGP